MLAVIAHDAGGAEIISSYIKQQNIECVYALDGPARKVFERKLGKINVQPLNEAIEQASSILCGTSWQSDIEIQAIKLARELSKPSVALLDHWINYRERFVISDELFLPDEIWVVDNLAENLANNIFPGLPIRLVDNPYFDEIRQEIFANEKKVPSKDGAIDILYVCEPIREHALKQHGDARYWGYVEEDALRYFLSKIALLSSSAPSIKIRPHPSEDANKYNWVLSEFGLQIEITSSQTLIQQIASCDIVVGCESMAMVVALLADKRVISSVPPGGRSCVLPHIEIKNLRDFVK